MKTVWLLLSMAVGLTAVWSLVESWLRAKRLLPDESESGINVVTALPPELRKAKPFGNEVEVACRTPARMHGKVDQVFLQENGEILLTETKRRKKRVVHKSDVVQLSAYRVAMLSSSKREVSGTGFIRLLTPEGNEYRKVKLLTDMEVKQVADRYEQIKSGRSKGSKCKNRSLCKGCLYRTECDAMSD